jgi:hypothetical protein
MIAQILLAHVIGDYFLQSHWMATEKTKRLWPAVVHGLTYTLPFLLITQNPVALFIIFSTHVMIDRWRLARYIGWIKNQFGPKWSRPPLTATGYAESTPVWLAFWLMIITDNVTHILINYGAVTVFG